MIAIIDYGVGNLFSLKSSLSYLGVDAVITREKAEIEEADKIILPGVGAFGDAADKLRATRLVPTLDKQVKDGKPLLGICLGMQLLLEVGYEYGRHEGLGYIKGKVVPITDVFDNKENNLKIPHMGWNSLHIKDKENKLFKYSREGDFVYFVHSYCAAGCSDNTIATTDYGAEITAVIAKDNVYGCQFHPEKSSKAGLNILKAFSEI